MDMNLTGKNGISIKLVTKKIQSMLKKEQTPVAKRKVKDSFRSGTLSVSDWKDILIGLQILRRLLNESFRIQDITMLAGDKDVSKTKKALSEYRYAIDDFVLRLSRISGEKYDIRKKIELLSDYSKIAEAARDGQFLKQETRTEFIDGKPQEIMYDTTIPPYEAIEKLARYERLYDNIIFERLNNYLGLGLGLAGTLGTLIKQKSTDSSRLITLGTTAVGGLKLIQGVLGKDDRKKQHNLRDKQGRLQNDLIYNEQVSEQSILDSISNISSIAKEEEKLSTQIESKGLLFDLIVDLGSALMSGVYVNQRIQTNSNGRIDGSSLSSALLSLQSNRAIAGNLVRSIQGFQNIRKAEQDLEQYYQEVRNIISQFEEKILPLSGAKKSFDSVEIKDFVGSFFPKTNYQTGTTDFSLTLNIPEFSMKRGDVVLLSGESGTGKSTFLRLLKRGDINNRNCIKIDDEQYVDHLGNEFISFKPSTNLGDENNVLYQITGKQNISDLDELELKKITTIFRDLNLDFPNLLEQLASKKFIEFSTGQQRRLALSKLFYRIDDGTSVIIVDEPVGNVEDSLIREQLEMIKNYAKEKDVMLLLTTHRLDLAEDLATKRYHIKDGIMTQLPLKKTAELENDETDSVEER